MALITRGSGFVVFALSKYMVIFSPKYNLVCAFLIISGHTWVSP